MTPASNAFEQSPVMVDEFAYNILEMSSDA